MKPKIWLYKNKETGTSKGEATVTYDDVNAAQSAIQWFDGNDFNGAQIKVSLAQRQNNWNKGGGGGGRGGFGGRNRGGGGGGGGGGGVGGAGGAAVVVVRIMAGRRVVLALTILRVMFALTLDRSALFCSRLRSRRPKSRVMVPRLVLASSWQLLGQTASRASSITQ